VRDPHGKTHQLYVEPRHTIKSLKVSLCKLVYISPDQQLLYYRGRPLDSRSTVKSCKLSDGDCISLKLPGLGGGGKRTRIDVKKMTVASQWKDVVENIRSTSSLDLETSKQVHKALLDMHALESGEEDIMMKRLVQVSSSKLEELMEIFSVKSGGTTERRVSEMCPIYWAPLYDVVKKQQNEAHECLRMLETACLYTFTNNYYDEKTNKYDVEAFKKALNEATKQRLQLESRQKVLVEIRDSKSSDGADVLM
jgi:hypothetical protein